MLPATRTAGVTACTVCDGTDEYQDLDGQSSCKICPRGTVQAGMKPNGGYSDCENINECNTNNGDCDTESEICQDNEKGPSSGDNEPTHFCVCKDGFVPSGSGCTVGELTGKVVEATTDSISVQLTKDPGVSAFFVKVLRYETKRSAEEVYGGTYTNVPLGSSSTADSLLHDGGFTFGNVLDAGKFKKTFLAAF